MERKFKVGNTTYKRSNYGVGKQIGDKLYVHKNYVNRVLKSSHELEIYESCLPNGFSYNCVMLDFKNRRIRFDEAPDFDSAREPHVGDYVELGPYLFSIRRGHSNSIWHHKWMWVDDDYTGFNVEESYLWSKFWTKYIRRPSGSERIWIKQLNESGIHIID